MTLLRNVEKAIFGENARTKHNNNSCDRNNYVREIIRYNWKLSETAPSCNDCVFTIVTEQFTQTLKGVKTVCPAFRKGNRNVISPDPRIRRGLET